MMKKAILLFLLIAVVFAKPLEPADSITRALEVALSSALSIVIGVGLAIIASFIYIQKIKNEKHPEAPWVAAAAILALLGVLFVLEAMLRILNRLIF